MFSDFLGTMTLIGYAMVAIFAVGYLGPKAMPLINAGLAKWKGSSVTPPAGTTVTAPTDDLTASDQDLVLALAKLGKRFAKSGCKEGQAAVQVCLTHILDCHEVTP